MSLLRLLKVTSLGEIVDSPGAGAGCSLGVSFVGPSGCSLGAEAADCKAGPRKGAAEAVEAGATEADFVCSG